MDRRSCGVSAVGASIAGGCGIWGSIAGGVTCGWAIRGVLRSAGAVGGDRLWVPVSGRAGDSQLGVSCVSGGVVPGWTGALLCFCDRIVDGGLVRGGMSSIIDLRGSG